MIICPQCQTSSEGLPNYCHHCGHELSDASLPLETNEVLILIEGNPHPIRLKYDTPIIFGRNVLQEVDHEHWIDLESLNAYDLGVSRRHARLDKISKTFVLTDLDSANGTMINDYTLVSNQAYPVPSGTHIYLAQLKIILFYNT